MSTSLKKRYIKSSFSNLILLQKTIAAATPKRVMGTLRYYTTYRISLITLFDLLTYLRTALPPIPLTPFGGMG